MKDLLKYTFLPKDLTIKINKLGYKVKEKIAWFSNDDLVFFGQDTLADNYSAGKEQYPIAILYSEMFLHILKQMDDYNNGKFRMGMYFYSVSLTTSGWLLSVQTVFGTTIEQKYNEDAILEILKLVNYED